MSKSKGKRPHTGRDYNMVNIIRGVTKAGVHKDLKKEASRTASRSKVELDEEEWGDRNCKQCGFFLPTNPHVDEDEEAAMALGFCSVSCMDYHYESKE